MLPQDMTIAQQIKQHRRLTKRKVATKTLFLTLGAIIAGVGLEMALIPNQLIDGGVTGISIMASHLTHVPLGFFLFLFNVPFLYLGYKQIGKSFTFSTAYAIIILSLTTSLLHHSHPFTQDTLLATIVGGIFIGIGVGITIRFGGCLDGSETLAILINKKVPFSVGQIILFMNLFILGIAGFIYGFDRFMYSLIAYFVAFKTIDIVAVGLDESKSVWIISDKNEEIAQCIINRLGRGVTFLNGRGGYSKEDKNVIFCIVTRLEEAKVKSIVEEIDPSAMLALANISEIQGGTYKKKDIH
jgi:uncharacterized membrane-anchored protein YitT (DUF2179 family)